MRPQAFLAPRTPYRIRYRLCKLSCGGPRLVAGSAIHARARRLASVGERGLVAGVATRHAEARLSTEIARPISLTAIATPIVRQEEGLAALPMTCE